MSDSDESFLIEPYIVSMVGCEMRTIAFCIGQCRAVPSVYSDLVEGIELHSQGGIIIDLQLLGHGLIRISQFGFVFLMYTSENYGERKLLL